MSVKRFKNTIRMSEDGPVDALVESDTGSWVLWSDFDALAAELETERGRLAACGVAALGYFKGCAPEYDSASLQDVLKLRRRVQALEAALRSIAEYDCEWDSGNCGGCASCEARACFPVETEVLCPRPCNGRPDGFTKAQCIAAGECGCTEKIKGEQHG